MSKAEQLIMSIENGFTMFNKGRGLELPPQEPNAITRLILYNGNPVGYVLDEYEVSEYTFIVLTLEEIFLPNRVAKQIAKYANLNQMLVVFVPYLDIGFGEWMMVKPMKQAVRLLNKISKFSQDDTKTAALAGSVYNDLVSPALLTYNQILSGMSEKYHAEWVICEILKFGQFDNGYSFWLSLLEPCRHCLEEMLECSVRDIRFIELHKDKWNTDDYYTLVSNITNKSARNCDGLPVKYNREKL